MNADYVRALFSIAALFFLSLSLWFFYYSRKKNKCQISYAGKINFVAFKNVKRLGGLKKRTQQPVRIAKLFCPLPCPLDPSNSEKN